MFVFVTGRYWVLRFSEYSSNVRSHLQKKFMEIWSTCKCVIPPLKEHCMLQKKIWIHLMQNIFRNQTVKNLTILNNPFKRYDWFKIFIKCTVKVQLMSPSQIRQLYHVMGAQLPMWFCYTDYHKFSFIFLGYVVKVLDQTHSKKLYRFILYPKQTWLISRAESLLRTWRIVFLKIFVYIT